MKTCWIWLGSLQKSKRVSNKGSDNARTFLWAHCFPVCTLPLFISVTSTFFLLLKLRANDGKEEKQWQQTAGHLLWNLPLLGQLLSCCATGGRWWVNVFHWGGAHWLTGGKLHGILEDICQRKPLGAWAITQIPEREQRESGGVKEMQGSRGASKKARRAHKDRWKEHSVRVMAV